MFFSPNWGRSITILIALPVLAALAGQAIAGPVGYIDTDRFGYSGIVYKYGSKEDAEAGTNPLGTINIGDRDLALYGIDAETLIIMGSWWYSTHPNGAGWGNTTGNTGVGFLQLYHWENAASSLGSINYAFGNFDGTYWTTFNFSASGSNADYANALARFSPFSSNTKDSGIYHSYMMNLQASGLQGVQNGNWIESSNQPTGVTGTFQGLFENTSDDPAKAGFYVFNLQLSMTNWAWENRDYLTYPTTGFPNSHFGAKVPEPGSLLLIGLGLASLTGRRSWRRP